MFRANFLAGGGIDVANTASGDGFCLNLNCIVRRNSVGARGLGGFAMGLGDRCDMASFLHFNFRLGKIHTGCPSTGNISNTLGTTPVTPARSLRSKLVRALPSFRHTRI